MPEREFNKYKNNMSFTYYGGQKEGQYEFTIPKAGTWIIVVEKGSYHNPFDIDVSISKEKPVKPAAVEGKKDKKKKKKGKKSDDEVTDAPAEEVAATEEPETE